jgi:hypothetical protein
MIVKHVLLDLIATLGRCCVDLPSGIHEFLLFRGVLYEPSLYDDLSLGLRILSHLRK